MLDLSIIDQVRSVFQHLESRYTFHITYHPQFEHAQEMLDLLNDVAGCSDRLSCEVTQTEAPILEVYVTEKRRRNGDKVPWRSERT